MAESFSAQEPAPQVTDAPAVTGLAAIQSAPDAQPAASDAATEKARARILDIARNDNEKAADAAQRERDNALRAEVVGKAVPELFLKLVDEMRDAVQLFNQSLRPPEGQSLPIVTWVETPNVALRDPNTGDGMRVRIARRGATFDLLLRFASRASRADVPLIEGHGDYGIQQNRTKTMVRIEGWVERGKPVFWYSLDFKRQSVDLEEVAERIVASIAANDYSLLSRDLASDPSDEQLRSDS
jgi:hypothetical protein